MGVWVFCIAAVALTLVAVARETETVPATGRRIALMLIPAAVVLMLGLSATGMRSAPLAVGTFALTWTVLSGLHPGRIWREPGAPGRRRAFRAPCIAIAAGVAVLVLTTPVE